MCYSFGFFSFIAMLGLSSARGKRDRVLKNAGQISAADLATCSSLLYLSDHAGSHAPLLICFGAPEGQMCDTIIGYTVFGYV